MITFSRIGRLTIIKRVMSSGEGLNFGEKYITFRHNSATTRRAGSPKKGVLHCEAQS